jgi:hypothetical protein
VDARRNLWKGPEISNFGTARRLVSGLRSVTGMILYQGSGDRGPHCQHCFDGVTNERCTMCESRRVAPIETVIKNWHRLSRSPSAA